MLFVIRTLVLTAIAVIRSTSSVRECYFCADLASKCEEDLRSVTPLVMTCRNFLVNQKVPKPLMHHPVTFKADSETQIFSPGLAKRNAKTRCVYTTFRYLPYARQELPNETEVDLDELYAFRSCHYKDLAEFNDTCNFIRNILNEDVYVRVLECSYCKKPLCNSQERGSGDGPGLVFVAGIIGLVVNLLRICPHLVAPNYY